MAEWHGVKISDSNTTLDLLHFSAAHEIYILKRQIKILPHSCEYTHMKNCQMCLHIVVFDIRSSIHLMQYVFLMVIWSACCSKAYSGLRLLHVNTTPDIQYIIFHIFFYSQSHIAHTYVTSSFCHSLCSTEILHMLHFCIFFHTETQTYYASL